MPAPSASSRASLRRAQLILAAVVAVLILVQAVIAGRVIALGEWDIEIHGWIGDGLFVLVVAAFALAIYRRAGTTELTVAAALAMLTFGQVGLGYVGREEVEATAWHIANGVLLMGLSAYQLALLQTGASRR